MSNNRETPRLTTATHNQTAGAAPVNFLCVSDGSLLPLRPLDRPSIVTIGSFDGVHRGHQHLIRQTVEHAREHGYLAVVVTFQPHPRMVLRPDVTFCTLTTLEQRIRLIERIGADVVVVVPFTPEVAATSAEDFVQALVDRLKMRELWVGPGFALGHRRQGTVAVLSDIGKRYGYTVHEVQPFALAADGSSELVSSTRIRRCLREGDVAQVAALLGRPYEVAGTVVHGAGRGRQLGFPTANLALPTTLCLPSNGIYAARVTLDAQQPPLFGAAYLGTRPMFDDGLRTLEVYILDFDADIYDRHLQVEFIARIRADERFPSLEAFLAQMQRDVAEVRLVLTNDLAHREDEGLGVYPATRGLGVADEAANH